MSKIVYPEDIKTIKKLIPKIDHLSDQAVENLWFDFSEDCFAATWMKVSMTTLTLFKELVVSSVDLGENE